MLVLFIRVQIIFFVVLLFLRIMGKRQIGELQPAELVVMILISELAAIPMQDGGIPLFSGVVPILTVLGVELVLATASLSSVSVTMSS